jgi:hypothetical protein
VKLASVWKNNMDIKSKAQNKSKNPASTVEIVISPLSLKAELDAFAGLPRCRWTLGGLPLLGRRRWHLPTNGRSQQAAFEFDDL